jgi:hypothetical protein
MALKETSGHLLKVGDRVRMNIPVIEKGDMDGVEFTADGKDYWRYMNEHPDEVYTVTAIEADDCCSECIYVLSGYMGDNTWASDELILVPQPETMFEVMKNLTREESPSFILSMIYQLCEEGLPPPEAIEEWLDLQPGVQSCQ